MRSPLTVTTARARLLRRAESETMEILADAKLMTEFRKGVDDLRRGRSLPWEEARKRLER
jgi:hypothetical protein